MSRYALDRVQPLAEQRHRDDQVGQHGKGPWLTFKAASVYVSCASVRAFYEWRKRHGIVASQGRVSRRDLDRALEAKRPLRRLHPNSLLNLHRRSRGVSHG